MGGDPRLPGRGRPLDLWPEPKKPRTGEHDGGDEDMSAERDAENAENLPALVESNGSDFDEHATPVAPEDSDSDDMDINAEGAQREFDDGRGTNDFRD